ncbi:unnamed protein product [Alopecurus aequalis]
MGRKKRKSKTLTAPSSLRRRCEDERRDWESLPQDVLRIVLSQLRQTDILGGAGLVFPAWRRLALEEPLLWRHIDLRDPGQSRRHDEPLAGWKAMARAALDASAGQCESFRGHIDADLLVHLSKSAPLLKDVCVAGWPHMPDEELATEIARKLPLLKRFLMCG